MPRGETFDRPMGECLGELVTDRVANRWRRSERESVGPKPIEHRAERVGAKAVWREHETPGTSALLQEAAREAPAWASSRSRRYFRGRKLVGEGRATSPGEGVAIVPAIGNHHFVWMHTPTPGDGGRAVERR